ncbi:uncharacterized protein YhfF [Acinetobacter calcoaceticus]|uniref:Uncharacterized protein YhfF n=1 Tax=Acinetobacter calcoaceticus TaxID=471 RepID=A0A4R1XWY6_ACICA|nr:uncharacterized protein YhfF [Acinetobacter calcoaceticus]
MHPTISQLWQDYRMHNPQAPEALPIAYHFCDNEVDAQLCLDLVLAGQKRATASSLAELKLNADAIPQVGDFAIITDWQGRAVCVIRTHTVEFRSFAEVDADFAYIEGEGDRSLTWWREAHFQYFSRVLAETDILVDDNLEIVCEQFELVFGARQA